MKRLRMPVMTTLHTVLSDPKPKQREVMQEIARHSDRLIVMSHLAKDILRDVYGAADEKVLFIPHGIPDVPFVDPNFHKDQFGVEGRTVILTFGLLAKSKGIEVAIRALPRIIERHPNVVYVVLGATHPHVFKREGHAYRESLENLAEELGVRDNIEFHNHFVSLEDLCGYIGSADIYVTPYPNPAQITSGTLAYALGAGKAVVSTPYWYAEEMLADGRGRLFPFGDSEALADEVLDLLNDECGRHTMRKKAYFHCREMVWRQVAQAYIEAAKDIAHERSHKPRRAVGLAGQRVQSAVASDVNVAHLKRLTDDTGILQHAVYGVPDRNHGYSTDDQSRALVAALLYANLKNDQSIATLIDRYLAFLYGAFDPVQASFRGSMTFAREWREGSGSEDVHGRVIWALGMAAALAPNEATLAFATRLFNAAIEGAGRLESPRAWAFTIDGIHSYLRRFGGDTHARRIRAELSDRLHQRFVDRGSAEWPWCDDIVKQDSAKLAQALILSGQWMGNAEMLQQGLRSLEWLAELQCPAGKPVSLIGTDGGLQPDGTRARFDQQPKDAMALIEACGEAYRNTHDDVWMQRARRCLTWFTGNNDTRSVLYDSETGGCRDGLHRDGANLNEGAEATNAWLISRLTLEKLEGERAKALAERVLVEEHVTEENVVNTPEEELACSR